MCQYLIWCLEASITTHAFDNIDYEYNTIHETYRGRRLIDKVHMARSVNQIEEVGFPRGRL
jgi:hypothetical protein